MSDVATRNEPMSIPEITDDEVNGLLLVARPLVRDREGVLHFIAWVHPRKVAFNWDPTYLHPVNLSLQQIGQFQTLHTYGAPMFFKPSAAEVLAQIPRHLLLARNIVGFETTIGDGPEFTEDHELHRATTILWGYV